MSGIWSIPDPLVIPGAGPHSFGGAASSARQFQITGTFAERVGLSLSSRLQPPAGVAESALLQITGGTIDKAGSGTHTIFSAIQIEAPTITAGGAALTNASTLYVKNAPAGATNNYALWVDDGDVRIDGSIFSSTTRVMEMNANGVLILGGTGSGSGGDLTGPGIRIMQGANDGAILEFESTDVAHGLTSILGTNVYGRFLKNDPDVGGMAMQAFGEAASSVGLALLGVIGNVPTAKSTAADAAVVIRGADIAGTSFGSLGTDGNILAVRDQSTTRFILDADGDSHQDVGVAWTNFDSHDDLDILNSLAFRVSKQDDPWKDHIRQYFTGALDSMLTRDQMQRMKLVTFNRDGHHFVNMSKLAMLHTGAIRQLGNRIREAEGSYSQMQDQIDQLSKQNIRLLRTVQRLERRLN